MNSDNNFSELLNNSKDSIFLTPLDQNYNSENFSESKEDNSNQTNEVLPFINSLKDFLNDQSELKEEDKETSTECDSEYSTSPKKSLQLEDYFSDNFEKSLQKIKAKVLFNFNNKVIVEEKIKAIFKVDL